MILHRFAILASPLALAAMLAAVPRQAPATYRLTQIGPDTIPIVLRNAEGKALLTIVRETLTLGPGDRVLRVTTGSRATCSRSCALASGRARSPAAG